MGPPGLLLLEYHTISDRVLIYSYDILGKAASGFIFSEDRNDMNMLQPACKAGSGYIYEISKSMCQNI